MFSFSDEEGSIYTTIVYRVDISLDVKQVRQYIYVDYEEEEGEE